MRVSKCTVDALKHQLSCQIDVCGDALKEGNTDDVRMQLMTMHMIAEDVGKMAFGDAELRAELAESLLRRVEALINRCTEHHTGWYDDVVTMLTLSEVRGRLIQYNTELGCSQ